MMKVKLISTCLTLAFSGVLSVAQAKVPADQAAQLKTNLTPMGAEKGANADGTIPEWTGGITSIPAEYKPLDHHPDPYKDDKVLYTITAENASQYQDKLSDGIKALLNKYPDSFKLNVYPTRRSYSAPQWVYDNTYNNALNAELVDGGNGFVDAYGGIPFPIAQNGQEAIWNHLARWRGSQRFQKDNWAHITPDGKRVEEHTESFYRFDYYQKGQGDQFDGFLFFNDVAWNKPARKKGEFLVIRDAVNQVKSPREAYRYLPGARRVKRAPTFAYDTPIGPMGSRTMDDTLIFNGAIDRYNWELVGKKELYIPYNSYKLEQKIPSDDLFTAKHPNPEYYRWELHRVYEVKATLKDGTRHVYAERTFYLDEDSWTAALIDVKDAKGAMWRVTMAGLKNYYEVPMMDSKSIVYLDLISGSYQAASFQNEADQFMDTSEATLKPEDYYSSQALRRRTRR
jgi:hypothetical protein